MAEIIKPTGEEYSHDAEFEVCPVCKSRDRDLIESLSASGAFLKDLAVEFGFKESTLRRHEAIHSTKPPNVDPLAILRHLRWLQEQADSLTRRIFNGQKLSGNNAIAATATLRGRIQTIDLSLKIATQMIELTGAKKYMDPHVVLPRWNSVMQKLVAALQDNQPAIDTLIKFMAENAPQGTVAEVKAKRTSKYGREIPIDFGGKEGTDGTEYSAERMSNDEVKKIWRRSVKKLKPPLSPEEEQKKKDLAEMKRQVTSAKRRAQSDKMKAKWKEWKANGTVPPTHGWAARRFRDEQQRQRQQRLRSLKGTAEPVGPEVDGVQPPSTDQPAGSDPS